MKQEMPQRFVENLIEQSRQVREHSNLFCRMIAECFSKNKETAHITSPHCFMVAAAS